jgi:hypothetical protein
MPVVGGGLTSPANRGVRNLAVFNGALYAGTSNGATGGEIWRSTDGLTWEPLMQGGFGNMDNCSMRGMAVFQSHLYIGVLSTGQPPGEIWRSADGVTFEPVIDDGFGVPQNQGVGTMEVFDNQLYVGTVNKEQGVQIWRSADGVNFAPSVGPDALTPSGFGNTFNKSVLYLHAFGGQLYVGLINVYGFEVYRTANGVVYERVIEDGLGDSGNAYAWRFETFEGALWLGVFSLFNHVYDAKGASLWRSFDGENWETMVGLNGTSLTYGFGDVRNWGIRSFAVYNDRLYIGTANCFHERCQPNAMGTEIWEWPGEVCP